MSKKCMGKVFSAIQGKHLGYNFSEISCGSKYMHFVSYSLNLWVSDASTTREIQSILRVVKNMYVFPFIYKISGSTGEENSWNEV